MVTPGETPGARLVWMLKSQRFLQSFACVQFCVAKAPIKFIASRTGKSKLGRRTLEIGLCSRKQALRRRMKYIDFHSELRNNK